MKFFINNVLKSHNNYDIGDYNVIWYDDCKEITSKVDFNDFIFCSIKDAHYFMMNYEYFNFEYYNLKVSDFLAPMYDYLVHDNSYFKHVCQLGTMEDFGKFIKSNNSKVLTGQKFDEDILKLCKNELPPDEMMFLSDYKDIKKEYRFWIKFDEIVAYSSYSWENGDFEEVPKEAIKFVESFLDKWSPHSIYVVDICSVDEMDFSGYHLRYKIVEYNSFGTSGFYNVDLKKLLNAIYDLYK